MVVADACIAALTCLREYERPSIAIAVAGSLLDIPCDDAKTLPFAIEPPARALIATAKPITSTAPRAFARSYEHIETLPAPPPAPRDPAPAVVFDTEPPAKTPRRHLRAAWFGVAAVVVASCILATALSEPPASPPQARAAATTAPPPAPVQIIPIAVEPAFAAAKPPATKPTASAPPVKTVAAVVVPPPPVPVTVASTPKPAVVVVVVAAAARPKPIAAAAAPTPHVVKAPAQHADSITQLPDGSLALRGY